jgi:hypothetical protein
LNPTWVEWLMGFPLGWTVLDASAMQSYHSRREKLLDTSQVSNNRGLVPGKKRRKMASKEDMIIVSKKDLEKANALLDSALQKAQEAFGFIESLAGPGKVRKPRAKKETTETVTTPVETGPEEPKEETPTPKAKLSPKAALAAKANGKHPVTAAGAKKGGRFAPAMPGARS